MFIVLQLQLNNMLGLCECRGVSYKHIAMLMHCIYTHARKFYNSEMLTRTICILSHHILHYKLMCVSCHEN